ncbi:MAG: hypothetical protein JSS02_28695, partial [Planctomycetes bacterium]|nr:hypothetical protein [Planctomycetota bacterium]
TTLFGFYHSRASLNRNDSQSQSVPASVLGIHVEGPSRDGFRFYPVLRSCTETTRIAPLSQFPTILPDGTAHDWALRYEPGSASQPYRIQVKLDGASQVFEFAADASFAQTEFDRFGIVTSWIDGNSQQVYWDDITYTVSQE